MTTLTISVLANTQNAERNLSQFNQQLTGMQGVTARLSTGLKTLAGGFLAFSAIDFLTDRIKRASDAVQLQERLLNQTNATLASTGNAANVTADDVLSLSDAIEKKSLIDAEAIQSGQNLLLTFTNIRNESGAGNDIFTQTVGIMADLSTAMGQDTKTSAQQLGKALNDPIAGMGALRRVGVTFTQDQQQLIRTLVESGDTMGAQKVILAELAKEFGGSAAASADTFAGRLKHLNDDLDTLFEEAVSAALPLLSALVEGFSAVIPVLSGIGSAISAVAGWFTDLPGPIQAAVISLAAIALLKGPVVSMFETIALRALYARDAVVASSIGMGTLKTAGSGLLSFFGGPWGLAIAGAVTGLALLTSWLSSSGSAAADAAGYQDDLARALEESNGVIDDNVRALAAQKAADTEVGDSNLLEVAQRLGFSLPQVTDALLGNEQAYRELTDAANAYYDASLTSENAGDLEFTQNAEDARQFAGALGELAPTMSRTQAEQALLAAATAESATAADGAAGATADYSGELEASEDLLGSVTELTNALKSSLDALTGSSVSMAEAESALQAIYVDAATALEDLDGTVVSATGSFDLNTEAGREAFATMNDMTDASNTLISSMLAQGDSADTVKAREAQLRQQWINNAMQMGFNAEQAEALANQYYGIPEDRYTLIDTNAAEVAAQVEQVRTGIANLPTSKNFTYNVKTIYDNPGTAVRGAGGTAVGFADGGYTGPGGKYQVAGLVHAGEFVFTQEDVNRIGLDALYALTGRGAQGQTDSYANGGYVYGGMKSAPQIIINAGLGTNPTELERAVARALQGYENKNRGFTARLTAA